MIADAPTFTIRYDREREHAVELQRIKARIAELEEEAAERARSALLTPAQRRVLVLMGYCLTQRQIAERLGVSRRTVNSHEILIYRKTGVRDRLQAALYAWRNGYVGIDEAWEAVKLQEWGIA